MIFLLLGSILLLYTIVPMMVVDSLSERVLVSGFFAVSLLLIFFVTRIGLKSLRLLNQHKSLLRHFDNTYRLVIFPVLFYIVFVTWKVANPQTLTMGKSFVGALFFDSLYGTFVFNVTATLAFFSSLFRKNIKPFIILVPLVILSVVIKDRNFLVTGAMLLFLHGYLNGFDKYHKLTIFILVLAFLIVLAFRASDLLNDYREVAYIFIGELSNTSLSFRRTLDEYGVQAFGDIAVAQIFFIGENYFDLAYHSYGLSYGLSGHYLSELVFRGYGSLPILLFGFLSAFLLWLSLPFRRSFLISIYFVCFYSIFFISVRGGLFQALFYTFKLSSYLIIFLMCASALRGLTRVRPVER